MELNLSPKCPQTFYKSRGGSYNIWSPSEQPILSDQRLGAAKLVLEHRGLAIPHYADSTKIAFVLQGCGVVGLLSPDHPKEKIIELNQGDALPVQEGGISWWYNHDKTSFVVLFLGVTPSAHVPGFFSYFFIAGANGIFSGFSPELLSQAWNIKEDQVKSLLKSQTGQIIVEIGEGMQMPKPCKDDKLGLVYRMIDCSSSFTSEETGLSAALVKLGPNAHQGPGYFASSGIEMVYVTKGDGRVEIVDMNGRRVMEAKVEEGCMFVVPSFFVAAKFAGGDGMDCISVFTRSKPSYGNFGGKGSLLNCLSPLVLEAACKVTPQLAKALGPECNQHD